LYTVFEKDNPFISFKAPALVYAVLIFFMSSLQGYELPNLPFYSFDKIVHLIEFGLFGIFLFRAFRYPRPFSHPYWLTLGVGIPYAALDEIHQLFVPGRNCSAIDFVMDVLGLMIFAGISSRMHPGEDR